MVPVDAPPVMPVNPPAPAAGPVPVTETPEFKDALAREREQMRLNYEAEYLRKLKEAVGPSRPQTPEPPIGEADVFGEIEREHHIPRAASEKLAGAIIGWMHKNFIQPMNESQKRQEVNYQRAEIRQQYPALAKYDVQYHEEVIRRVQALKPEQIGPDTYVKALQMVVGEHLEDILKTEARQGNEPPPTQPGDEIVSPTPSSRAPETPKPKLALSEEQKNWSASRKLSEEEFVEMMRGRARKLMAQGISKEQIRGRLGSLLGTIDF